MSFEHVKGKDKGNITLYALSTCIWCKMTKELLDELNVSYSYCYVDLLQGEEKEKVVEELKKWNPSKSFPTLIINDKCIKGFKEEEIKESLQ